MDELRKGLLDIHPSTILGKLSPGEIAGTVIVFDRVSSTNEVALEICRSGFGQGWLIIAESQREGRGRMGRSWFSTEGKGLTFSIILERFENSEELTILAALSVIDAIEQLGIDGISIKWPNDVFLGGRKLCGILAEVSGEFVVVGVGLNVNEDIEDFPTDLRLTATSLKEVLGRTLDRGVVLVRIVESFRRNMVRWEKGGLGLFRERILSMLLYLGEDVVVRGAGGMKEGRLVGITDRGRLVLNVHGEEIEIISGDVSLRKGM